LKGELIVDGVRTFPGELEIDASRGVIYFHCSDEKAVAQYGSVSILRICGLPHDFPERAIDLTLVGCNSQKRDWIFGLS
jgi:hypothetical protein